MSFLKGGAGWCISESVIICDHKDYFRKKGINNVIQNIYQFFMGQVQNLRKAYISLNDHMINKVLPLISLSYFIFCLILVIPKRILCINLFIY